MADNTLQGGTDNISTDEVTTLNGAASSGVKVQRIKVGFGVENQYKDVNEVEPLPVQVVSGRTLVGRYAYASFRTVGTASALQNLFTIENPAASGRNILVLRMTSQNDSTGVLTSVSPAVKTSRISIPSGGTIGVATKFVSAYANPVGVVRNATASDGGAATAITATAGNTISSQFVDRQHTSVGQIVHDTSNMLPQVVENMPFELVPGEALLVQAVLANAATTHFIVNLVWEEYT